MTLADVHGLTLAEMAAMLRAAEERAVKDKTYRKSRLGLEVGHYMRYLKNEYGARPETLRDYEAILAKLALDHPKLELADFEPPEGTQTLRAFIERRWGEAAPRTRKKVRSVLMSFFRWANGEFKLRGNPVEAIKAPRLRDVDRQLFTPAHVELLIASQPELSSRVAIRMLFEMALRKNELRLVQFKHFDLGRRRLKVFGKGGTIIDVPIPSEDLRLELEKLMLKRSPDPREFLLYPVKRGPIMQAGEKCFTSDAPIGVVWENRLKPLDANGMQRWWRRCIENAGIPYINMHSARHTAITDFLRKTGNLKLAQQLARHKDVGTTANTYGHTDDSDLEAELRRIHGS
jgi:integrase/recombinase XerC